MDVSGRTVNLASVLSTELKQMRDLEKRQNEFELCYEVLQPEILGIRSLVWPPGKERNNAKMQMLIEANGKPHDIVIYEDCSVSKDRSGWGVHCQAGWKDLPEESADHRVTTSSLTMEAEVATLSMLSITQYSGWHTKMTHGSQLPSFSQTQ